MNLSSNSRIWKLALTKIAVSSRLKLLRDSFSSSEVICLASSSPSQFDLTVIFSPSPELVHNVFPSLESLFSINFDAAVSM
jgi:hypothetical protein